MLGRSTTEVSFCVVQPAFLLTILEVLH